MRKIKKWVKATLIILVCAIGGIPISIWNERIAFMLLFSGILYVIVIMYYLNNDRLKPWKNIPQKN